MNMQTIEPAQRSQIVQEYYFSRKRKQLDAMKQSGIDVINLGIGSPDMPPSPEVINALHENAKAPSNHGYQSYIGTPALREAFSKWYKTSYGVDLNPANEILPLVGSKEGIMHISMAFLNEGDEVLIPNPGYPTYEAATKLAGGRIRYYNLSDETGWLPDLSEIESAGLENVKIMWVNYPNMPTGKKASIKVYQDLVKFAKKHHILLCNDNPYSFILNDEPISLLAAEGAKDIALELNSLSKSHNMAGWRIGMVGGNSEYISAILRVKSNMDSGMFQPLQAAAVEALNAPAEWYSGVNDVYRERRRVAEEIMDILHCSFDKNQAGLFLWGRIPSKLKFSEELTEPLLQKAHVFITPGHIFGSNGNNYIRISLCAPADLMAEAKKRIAKEITSIF